MKTNFTKKEYKLLIEMLHLGEWIINSNVADVDEEGSSEHRDLYQKILSLYKEMNADDFISFDKKHNIYDVNQQFENFIHKEYLGKYEDEYFWDELIYKLAVRDLIEKIGEEKFKAMNWLERGDATDSHKEKYIQEFDKFGISRLKTLGI